MTNDCIFCKIAKKEIPAEVVYEGDDFLIFKDINAQAPVHFIAIPKEHIETLNDVSDAHSGTLGDMLIKMKDAAKEAGVAEDGYRVVINCNKGAGQEVFHIHMHLLGGRKFTWPPG